MTKKNLEQELFAEEMKRTGGNISKVARHLGLDYYALREQARKDAGLDFVRATEPEPEDIRTLGRPGFRVFVIAVKPKGSAWPAKYADVINEARRKFDAGTHDMYQTSNGGWVVQYLIPLANKREACRFFSTMTPNK